MTVPVHPAFSILHRTREELNVAVAPQKRFVGFVACLFSVPWLLVGMHLLRIGVSDGRTLAGCVFLVVMGLILLAAGSRMIFERTIVQMSSAKWTVTQSHSFGERTHLRSGTQRLLVRKNNLRVRTDGRAPVTVLSGKGYLLEVVSSEPSEPAFPIVVMNQKADAEALAECLRLG